VIIQWLDDAVDDLQSLRNYISEDNPLAANSTAKRIIKSINLLANQPWSGRIGRVTNTRELVISGLPYIIPYRVKNNSIEILRVLHAAMQWPEDI
jgi:toxin ParE1/3/4